MFDLVDPSTAEVTSFKGSTALAEHIRDNEEVRLWIEKAVMQKVKEGYAAQEQSLEQPRSGDDEAEGKESSEKPEREESSGERSDTVGERGHLNGKIPRAAQADNDSKVTLAQDLGLGAVA